MLKQAACFLHAFTRQNASNEPMNSDVTCDVIPGVKHKLKSVEDAKTMWGARSSFVNLVLLYSDKPKASMKASRISFYRLHICLLNVSDETRHKLIVGGHTILTYLPCKFPIDSSVSEDALHASLKTGGKDLVERCKTVHEVIHDILSPFVNKPYEVFGCHDNSGRSLHCPAIFAACLTGIPEAKDLSPVKGCG